jgi:5'-3' exonuclease
VGFVREKSESDAAWRIPEIVFSTHRRAGEGEQKIPEAIRSDPGPPRTFCVFSPDGDLIPVFLQTHETSFCVMREWNLWMGRMRRSGTAR